MKNKTLITICLIVIALIILIGGYYVFIKDNNGNKKGFLKLEKIVLKDEEKKVKVNNKEISLKLNNGLLINDNKLNVELINNIYNTGDYLIISYKGNENEKYVFINEEGKQIEVIRENINDDLEFSNLRLDTNKLVADTQDEKVEIIYKEGKIIIKKDNQ